MNFLYILLALLIFGVLIFIHELGHFIAARLCGVQVLEFAIGMGPKLLSWQSKKSGTKYALRLFPIGGFVNMLGENGMEAVQGSAEAEAQDATAPDEDGELKQPYFLYPAQAAEPEHEKEGETVELTAEQAKHAYCNQSVWKRILISFAGPLMNILLGFVLMLSIVLAVGQENLATTDIGGFYVVYQNEDAVLGLKKNDYVYDLDGERIRSFAQFQDRVANDEDGLFRLRVLRDNATGTDYEVVTLENIALSKEFLAQGFDYSRSEQSNLCVGDKVIKVNKVRVHTYYELSYEIMEQGYQAVELTVLRNGETVILPNVVFPNGVTEGVKTGYVDFIPVLEDDFSIGTVLKHTWFRSVSMVKMVFDTLEGLFSGRYSVEAVSGPVGITKTISKVAKTGILNIISLVTIISINLGVMNLLPIPALDGGHLLIYIVELIRRKPLNREVEGMINFIGLILMLALAVIIAIKDVIAL